MHLTKMWKRRRALTQAEMEKIAEGFDLEADSDSEYDSDDSVKDPGWDTDAHESSDEDDETDIPTVVQNVVFDENSDDSEQSDDESIASHSVWTDYVGRHKVFPFTGQRGVQKDLPKDISPLEAFLLIVDDEVINHIVTETNRFAKQTLGAKPKKKYARISKWVPTDADEMKKFLGLTLWMGLVRLGALPDYWASQGIYRQEIPRSVMSRNRYQLLLSTLHFNNNETNQRGDRLAKIQPLVDMLQRKFQEFMYPDEDIVIDETLVPWRGRLIFRQYIPNKAHRYGIKLFKLCSINGYTWSLKIYSGKSATGQREVGLAKNVCHELCGRLLNQGRTLYVDNFYTSYELAISMLENKTHLVGTLRANKKHMPKEVLLAKLKKGEMVCQEDQNGIVIVKWKDTRDVRLLSTKHAPEMVPVNLPKIQTQSFASQDQATAAAATADMQPQPSTSRTEPTTMDRKRKSRKVTSKPLVVLAYNKGKAGIDLSDQMASYATTLRKGIKWYRKLAIELLLGTAVVNAWVLYKHASKTKMKVRVFRENLAAELLNVKGQPQPEKLRTPSSSYHHLLQRVNV